MMSEIEFKPAPSLPLGGELLQDSATVPAKKQILIVEDDAALGRFLTRELTLKNFAVEVCQDGEEAFARIDASSYDLILLDMNLPKIDGMDLLQQIHGTHPQLPILVLTARNTTEDLVQALEHGAQDYLIKPFSLLELLARIRTLLRRTDLHAALPAPRRRGTLSINKQERRIVRGDRSIDLTPREFALLEHLMENMGKPVSRSTLMQEVWNMPFDPNTNIVDVYMKYLRDKIDVEGEPKLIRTVRGVGYVLSVE
ncbi:MAG TPA: response regulator transcription factor [Acidobacteriaceae bacterium]|jgi:DNA-binding response OmpR family regulator